MSKFSAILAVAIFGAFAPAGFCTSSLQDYGFDVNGTWYSATTTVPGLDSSAFNTTDGQGALTFTFNKAGSYNVNAWFFDALSTPFYNEYGTTSGSPGSGQSWQIDVPDYDTDSNHTGTIIANTQAGKLDNTNHVPGQADDYSGGCSTGANCNDATSMAMGFKFTLKASQTEYVTFGFTTSAPTSKEDPSGFYLEQIHPVDGSNTTPSDLFFYGAISSTTPPPPPPPGVPEPASWTLLTAGLALVGLTQRRRFSKR